jgi:hypothetical protein
MSKKPTASSSILRRLAFAALVTSALSLQGCATAMENIAVGAGLGAVGTVAALGCMLTCQGREPGW